MLTNTIREHIDIVDEMMGPKARVAGSRIRVQDIVIWHDRMMMSVDEIVAQYPQLSYADIYAALAYYWDHHDEFEQQMKDDDAFVEELRRTQGSPLIEKLMKLSGRSE